MKQTVKLFVHQGLNGIPVITTTDMRHHGYPLLSTEDVEVEVPELQPSDLAIAEVNALNCELELFEAEASKKRADLTSKIEKAKGGLK